MALVTVEDVTDYMALSFVEGHASVTAASAIIDGIEADLRTYVRRPIVETSFVDQVVTIRRDGGVLLTNTPVKEVTAFSVDGEAIDLDEYEVTAWGFHVRWPFMASPLISPRPVVLVSYVGGLPGNDATSDFGRQARAVIKRAAARDIAQVVIEKAPGVARFNVEGTDISFTGGVKAGAGGLLDAEKDQFKRFKRKVYRA